MEYQNASEAFVEMLAALMRRGSMHQSRSGVTRELLHQTVSLTHPLERCIVVPGRRNDVFAAIAETLWVIQGRDDLQFLSRYVPRAAEFSDDGVRWRAGYGPRLRRWHDENDQLAATIAELRSNPGSRRAVISLFDPALDRVDSSDVPCTNWLQFTLRDGVLSLAVTVRSNDLVWGFSGINTFEWSVLQEIVAYWLDARVGAVTYFIGSLHLYERHFERATAILSARPDTDPYADTAAAPFATSFDAFDEQLVRWFDAERCLTLDHNDLAAIDHVADPLLRDFIWMIAADAAARVNDTSAVTRALDHVTDSALVAAAAETLRWRHSIRLVEREAVPTDSLPADLGTYLMSLHREKTAGYGSSWKKRGEAFGVLPNIDRKIDRMVVLAGQPAATTESLFDTAADLFVYAVKYKTLLLDSAGSTLRGASWSDDVDGFEELVPSIISNAPTRAPSVHEVAARIAAIEDAISDGEDVPARLARADALIEDSWALLLRVTRQDEGSVYREFARQRRSEARLVSGSPVGAP